MAKSDWISVVIAVVVIALVYAHWYVFGDFNDPEYIREAVSNGEVNCQVVNPNAVIVQYRCEKVNQ